MAQGYDGDDTQLRFVLNDAPATLNSNYDVAAFEYAYALTDSGWNVELKLPFSAMPFAAQPDKEIGLDLQVNDNDEGQRQHILKWWSESDDSWRDPSLFGTAQFVTSNLIADFVATPTSGSPPLSVAFTDQTSGEVTSRVWDFGGGDSSTDTNPVHIYQTSGVYSVSLTVTGPEGTATRERQDYIHVSSAPPLPWRAELDYNPVFDDAVIPEIFIFIDPDSLALIFHPDSLESRHEYPATFVFNNGAIVDTVENVGFRLRGNTSRFSAKKSFKVSFNSFQRGGKYFGLEKLNLNGEHNDPSIIRSKLCWDLFKKMRVPSSRANHVKVFINGEYRGLYINVEHIDENFVRSRFGGNDGNLYKCLWPADLTYVGSNPDLYKFEVGGRRTYALKTNRETDDYSDLAEFISVLNQTPDHEFADAMQQIFNVNCYLRVLAIGPAGLRVGKSG